MKHKVRKLNFAVIASAGMALALVVMVAFAATQTIDAFTVESVDIEADSSTTSAVDDSATNTAILGDERDSHIEWQSGSSNIVLRIDVLDSNFLEFQSGTGTHGKATITWDGDDADSAATLDATGLSGVDLVDTTNDGIVFTVSSFDGNAVDLTITIYTNSTSCSSATVPFRGTAFTTATLYALSFDDDFSDACASGATFTDAGAIVVEIQTVAVSADLALNLTVADPTRDFGDLPDTYNITTHGTDNGARHTLGGTYFGTTIDTELDGQETTGATGEGSDDDGVTRPTTQWTNGTDGGHVSFVVTSPMNNNYACVDGWIDWNDDADFDDTDEHVIDSLLLYDFIVDNLDQDFDVPSGTFGGSGTIEFYSRWRISPDTDGDGSCSDETNLSYDGYVQGGEVEDYLWEFNDPTAITLESLSATPGAQTQPILWVSVLLIVASGGLLVFRRRKVKAANK